MTRSGCQLAVFTRRVARDSPKGPRERAMIREAAVERDLCDAGIGLTQQPAADGDARLRDHLHRADAVDALHDTGEAHGWHACSPRQ